MFGISFAELMIIFLLILVVMGPEKLPQVARWAGKGLREVRKASNTLRNALAMDELEDLRSIGDIKFDDSRRAAGPAPKVEPAEPPSDTLPKPTPAPPSQPPSGLDQVDPDDFDRMLERQYQIRRTELATVELAPAAPSDDLVTVAIAATGAGSSQRLTVALSAPPAAEIA